jgi:hypothetical protein
MYRRSNAAAATTAIGPSTVPAMATFVRRVCRPAAPIDPGVEGRVEAVLVLGPGETIPVVSITVEIVVDGGADVEGTLDNVLLLDLERSIELWVIDALKLEDGRELGVSENVGTVPDNDDNEGSGLPSS